MDHNDQPDINLDEYTVLDIVTVTEVHTDDSFAITFAIGDVEHDGVTQLRSLTGALLRAATFYDQATEELAKMGATNGVWVVTQTKGGKVRHYTADSEGSAHELAENLPGNIEVTYQYALGEQ